MSQSQVRCIKPESSGFIVSAREFHQKMLRWVSFKTFDQPTAPNASVLTALQGRV